MRGSPYRSDDWLDSRPKINTQVDINNLSTMQDVLRALRKIMDVL